MLISWNFLIKAFCLNCCCSVPKLGLTLCASINCSMPGFPVHHHLTEHAQTHFHCVHDAIQPSHPLSPLSPPALSLSQFHDLFQWVDSLHQVAKVLELQLQHWFFQWIFRIDFFRINWFYLLAVQGTFKCLLQHHRSKASVLWCSAFLSLWFSFHICPWLLEKL